MCSYTNRTIIIVFKMCTCDVKSVRCFFDKYIGCFTCVSARGSGETKTKHTQETPRNSVFKILSERDYVIIISSNLIRICLALKLSLTHLNQCNQQPPWLSQKMLIWVTQREAWVGQKKEVIRHTKPGSHRQSGTLRKIILFGIHQSSGQFRS